MLATVPLHFRNDCTYGGLLSNLRFRHYILFLCLGPPQPLRSPRPLLSPHHDTHSHEIDQPVDGNIVDRLPDLFSSAVDSTTTSSDSLAMSFLRDELNKQRKPFYSRWIRCWQRSLLVSLLSRMKYYPKHRSMIKPIRPYISYCWNKYVHRDTAKSHPKTLNCKKEECPYERCLRQAVGDCGGYIVNAKVFQRCMSLNTNTLNSGSFTHVIICCKSSTPSDTCLRQAEL